MVSRLCCSEALGAVFTVLVHPELRFMVPPVFLSHLLLGYVALLYVSLEWL